MRVRWEMARAAGSRLLQAHPNSLEVKIALGDLLRMGHNLDVPGAAEAADRLLKEVIAADPDNFAAYFTLASMYVTLDPQYAPAAERYFLKAETLVAPRIVPDIYQGLGFACIAQQKVPETIDYFEKYMKMQGDEPFIRQLVALLKAGNKPRIIRK